MMRADQYSLKKSNLFNHLGHAYMYLMAETTFKKDFICLY